MSLIQPLHSQKIKSDSSVPHIASCLRTDKHIGNQTVAERLLNPKTAFAVRTEYTFVKHVDQNYIT